MARLKVTITVPDEWVPRIEKYMRKMGYTSMADFLRDLLREKIIEQYESAKADEKELAVGVVA